MSYEHDACKHDISFFVFRIVCVLCNKQCDCVWKVLSFLTGVRKVCLCFIWVKKIWRANNSRDVFQRVHVLLLLAMEIRSGVCYLFRRGERSFGHWWVISLWESSAPACLASLVMGQWYWREVWHASDTGFPQGPVPIASTTDAASRTLLREPELHT